MAGFEAAVDAISSQGLPKEHVHPMMMLAFGMMLAEFNRTEFADRDEEASLQKPPHVAATPLALAHSETLTEAVRVIWSVKKRIIASVVTNSALQ